MSGGEVRHLSGEHLQQVQNLIERCIQLHMSKIETVNVLSRDANVEPVITELVWQRLEEENQDFFQFYYTQLALKGQIKRFNDLLKKQATLMEQIQPTEVAHMGVPNGSRMAQFQQRAGRYPVDQTVISMPPENLQPPIPARLAASYTNGVSSLPTNAYDLSTQSRRINFHPDALRAQNSNPVRLMDGLNGGIIKSESGYPSDTQNSNSMRFDVGSSIGEPQGPLEDTSVASFSGLDASSQPMTDTLLGITDSCSSFGQLGLIPRIFSFPDLSAFPHVLDDYQNSAYTDNFLDRSEIQDESRGPISGSYNTYEDFGSD